VALRAKGVALEVLPGSEIQLFGVEFYRREYEAGVYCHLGDDPAFTLLEFAWQVKCYPSSAPEHVRWSLDRGTRAIIAHSERHSFFLQEPHRLRALVSGGAWLEITVGPIAYWNTCFVPRTE
jgi:protein-tyrosine phosphatase